MHWTGWLIDAVIVLWVLPAAMRENTALVLVVAWGLAEAFVAATGNKLPIGLYVLLDVLSIILIASWVKGKDWLILALYPLMWTTYLAGLDPRPAWFALWGLQITQFLISGRLAYLLTAWGALNELVGLAAGARPRAGDYRRAISSRLRPAEPAAHAADRGELRQAEQHAREKAQ